MRTREKERFLRLRFTEKELEIRDRLYKERGCKRNAAKYKIVITEETDSAPMDFFIDNPEAGQYIDTIYFSFPWQFEMVLELYEGLFYQLFDMETGKRIGYGGLDPDSPVEEIRETVTECCKVCKFCFWHGMLFNENKNGNEYYCYRR